MPYIKITGAETGNNKGSCKQLVRYLEKENKLRDIEDRELFFSHHKEFVSSRQVINHIDNNKACLGKSDAKFYMVTINPSEKEIMHLGNDKEKFKSYTREVMDEYAKNFKKDLEGKDLVYYAKVEDNRYFKGSDPEVQSGFFRQGDPKEGRNLHIHVIVSRKDLSNKIKLSPTTNHRSTQKGAIKGGFDRVNFKQICEENFDKRFNYNRQFDETFQYFNSLKNGSKEHRLDKKVEKHRAISTQKNAIKVTLEKRQNHELTI